MKRIITTLLCACLISTAAQAKGSSRSDNNLPNIETGKTLTVTVKRIIDGDTIEASDGRKIRLWGFDTPENSQYGYWFAGMLLESFAPPGSALECTQKDMDI